MKITLMLLVLLTSVPSLAKKKVICRVDQVLLNQINDDVRNTAMDYLKRDGANFTIEFVHGDELSEKTICNKITNRGTYTIFEDISYMQVKKGIEQTEVYTENDRNWFQAIKDSFGLLVGDEDQLYKLVQKKKKNTGLLIEINDGYADDLYISGFTSEQLLKLKLELQDNTTQLSLLLDTSLNRSYNSANDKFTSYKKIDDVYLLNRNTGEVSKLKNY